jgi:hypothetical protein
MLRFDPDKHEYWLSEGGREVKLPSVTQILADVGILDASEYRTTKKLADGREVDARTFGTYVHQACHYDDLGTLDEDTLDAAIKPYLGGYRAFKRDVAFKVLLSEVPSYHPQYRYAGTPDKAGLFERGNICAIVDIKTGAPSPWHRIQLAAYSFIQRWEDCAAPGRFGLYLNESGTYKLIEYKDRQDGQIFLSALAVFNWKRNLLKTMEDNRRAS